MSPRPGTGPARLRTVAAILLAATALAACAEREVILPGERLSIRPDGDVGVLASATAAAAPEALAIS
ncbi:MAG: hypothetical protein AAF390_19520, partial [Pseudomonadota bacterium]